MISMASAFSVIVAGIQYSIPLNAPLQVSLSFDLVLSKPLTKCEAPIFLVSQPKHAVSPNVLEELELEFDHSREIFVKPTSPTITSWKLSPGPQPLKQIPVHFQYCSGGSSTGHVIGRG